MMQYVHIDEKWFTLVTNGNGYYLSTAEQQNYGNVKHKKHITKVMFLLAIARPRIIPSTGEMFDGKIGIWAFAHTNTVCGASQHLIILPSSIG